MLYYANAESAPLKPPRAIRWMSPRCRWSRSAASLPIIIDPSHAAGKSRYIESLSLAGIAAGADGLIIEVHPEPKVAMSDAAQQLHHSGIPGVGQKGWRSGRRRGKGTALLSGRWGRPRLWNAFQADGCPVKRETFSTGWKLPVENKAAPGFPGKWFPRGINFI